MTVHRSHRLAGLLAAGAAAGALAAPPAVARPIDTPQGPLRADNVATVPVEPKQTPPRAPVVQEIDIGFDWGSAAIGAGGAGALFALVSLGGVAIVSRHRIGVAR
jgi:hypothetical protein